MEKIIIRNLLPAFRQVAVRILFYFSTLLCILSASVVNQSFAQANLLRDLNDFDLGSHNEFSLLTAGNGNAYFVSNSTELWTSYRAADGSDVTEKLRSFIEIANLELVGNILYFAADDGNGMELWKSNGTPSGTLLVKEIRPGTEGGQISNLTGVNGILFFTGNDGIHGTELWKSNGTSTGTAMVKDILSVSGSSKPNYLTDVNGTLFFSASDGQHGFELWKSNGTAAGTVMVKDIVPTYKVGSGPESLVDVNGILYFTASTSATGRELYRSNGTAGGTILVEDIRVGTNSSGIANMTSVNGVLYFSANDGVHGHELWKSNGTAPTTVLVKDMTPGPAGSHGETPGTFQIANFTDINGTLFFTAYRYDDYFVWKSNGTADGTIPLFLTRGPGSLQPQPLFTLMNGYIYFFDNPWDYDEAYNLYRMDLEGEGRQDVLEFVNSSYNPELVIVADLNYGPNLYVWGAGYWSSYNLYRIDETGNWTFVADPFESTDSSNPNNYLKIGDLTYFAGQITFYESNALIRTDGTPDGTYDVIQLEYMIGEMEAANNEVYVSGRDWLELYRTNWSSYVINDYGAPPAVDLTYAGGNVYYTNSNGEVWKINGTTNEVSLMKDFFQVTDLDLLGSRLLIRVTNATGGDELWKSNGTPAGTVKFRTIKNIAVTPALYYPTAAINDTYFFVANDGVHGNEIWRTQATFASTYMITDINTNDNQFLVNGKEYDIRNMAVFRDSLYFSAIDTNGQWSLFKTDGTATGLIKVRDLGPVQQMVPADNKLYLFTADEQNSLSLWVTDGSASGTVLIKELLPPSPSINTELIEGILYFNLSANPGLWRTDGTVCGTFSFSVGVDGPYNLSAVGGELLFDGFDPLYGHEPFVYDINAAPSSPCESTRFSASMQAQSLKTSGQEGDLISSYPNPFNTDFVFRLYGDSDQSSTVEILTPGGKRIDFFTGLKANTDYRIGSEWPDGILILKIQTGARLITKKVIKRP